MTVLGFDPNTLLADDRSTDIIRALFPFILMVVGGIIFIFFYTLQFVFHSWIVAWSVLGVATIVAGASLLFGGLLGFLFGIPRTGEATRQQSQEQNKQSQEQNNQNSSPDNTKNSESADAGNAIQANTNLEDISDWLTKILVGVGLTQIGEISQAIAQLIDWLAPGFSDGTPEQLAISKGFTLALFVYFNIAGFFIGFLWARLYLPSQFRQADVGQVKKEIDTFTASFRKELNQLVDNDKAKNIVNKYIELKVDSISQDKLYGYIEKSDLMTQSTIYNDIQRIRYEKLYGKTDRTPKKLEKAIDVLKAFVKIDKTAEEHYLDLTELGILMKEKENPDWEKSEEFLSQAIQVRPDSKKSDASPEFHRAMCSINLDANFKTKLPTSSAKQKSILEDLKKSVKHEELLVEDLRQQKSETEPETLYLWNGQKQILPWLEANNIDLESLQVD